MSSAPGGFIASDYLALGALMRERLAEVLPDLPVEGLDEMAAAVEGQDLRPVVLYVVWSGDRFADALSTGPVIAYQQWTVYVRALNASQVVGNARGNDAGPVMARVHRALAGWRPEGAHRPLRRAQGQRPNYTRTSGLFPLTFETNIPL